jgi:hypothetical protein
MSSTYHPQTDGQTERVNQCLEHYLCSMLLHHSGKWTKWLPLAQWWYNLSYHRSLKTSLFQALFSYAPPQLPLGHPPKSHIVAVDEFIKFIHLISTQLRANLLEAQDRMKIFVDRNRIERTFIVSD